MKRIVAAVFALVLAVAATPGDARANGRFPESNQLFFAPNDPQLLVLRTTFGLLVSKDRGASWEWLCEEALGLTGNEDPMLALLPSGAGIATTFQGLGVAPGGVCDWGFAGGDLAQQVFIDLAANGPDPQRVVVFASSYDRQDEAGNILFTSKIWETKDDGKTFAPVGPPLDPELLGYTLDLAKSDANRIYVSAVRDIATTPRAFIVASKDRGATWTQAQVAFEGTERGMFIAAVDPKNADRVYVRTSNGTDRPSRLLVSDDGGATFRTIYTAQGALLAFSLTDDGSKVWIGGPKDGIRVASTTDFVFQEKSPIEVQCLAAATDGLWACSNEKSGGFIVAVSKDDGVTFEKKTRLCDIKGPLACPAGTRAGVECPPRWEAQRTALGCGGRGGDGGGDGGEAGSPVSPDDGLVEAGGGCDCRAARTSPVAAIAGAALAAVGLLAMRRRIGHR